MMPEKWLLFVCQEVRLKIGRAREMLNRLGHTWVVVNLDNAIRRPRHTHIKKYYKYTFVSALIFLYIRASRSCCIVVVTRVLHLYGVFFKKSFRLRRCVNEHNQKKANAKPKNIALIKMSIQ
jgi:hypothetical protein